MKQNQQVSVRLKDGLLTRLQRLVPEVQADERWRYTTVVRRSTVIRMALERGIRALEEEYGLDSAEGR